MGVRVLLPTDEGENSSIFNPVMLKEAIRIKLVEEVPDAPAPAQAPEKPAKTGKAKVPETKKAKHKLPFSVNPAELEGLKLEDLRTICISEYMDSVPEGKELEETNFPDPQTKEEAIAYVSANFGK